MRYPSLGHRLPRTLAVPLFGDRERYGIVPISDDPDWQEWGARLLDFYDANQRASIGLHVNRGGYEIMRQVDLEGKRVLEIGPAALDHVPFWTGKPARFTCLDINQDAIDIARARLEAVGVASEGLLLDRPGETQFPIADESFDVVLSFYAFEHIHPLAPHVAEVHRVLKSGGVLAGAIPCEGGLGWGLGRYLTSRRWLKSNTTIDPDKIICWEHPNFADRILSIMTDIFPSGQVSLWPLRVPLIDVNLIARFVLTKA